MNAMTHPENRPEPIIEDLAYQYQTLRCWILNEIVDERAGQPEELRQKAIAILEKTKR